MMHSIPQFEITQCKLGVIDERVERIELRLVHTCMLHDLGVEALQRTEVVALQRVKTGFSEKQIAGLVGPAFSIGGAKQQANACSERG